MITDYMELVQLHANRETIRIRRMVDIADAVQVALGKRSIPAEWYPHLCNSQAEADQMVIAESLAAMRE